MPLDALPFLETLQVLPERFLDLWWLWLFIAFFFIARGLWLAYIQEYWRHSFGWVMYELRIPREVRKSPKAMEQVFMSLHGIRNAPGNIQEKWWDGEISLWFSFEVASFGGEVHLYVRIPDRHRNLVPAALYAQYPDIEVVEIPEADDYINRFPARLSELYAQGYKLFGSELCLFRPDAYPIRTYVEFESPEEERTLDPVAALLETMAKVERGGHVWVQILVQPADDTWKKEGEKLVKKMRDETGRTTIETGTGKFVWIERTPGELDVLKALDRNIAKPGFKALIRYLAIGPRVGFDEAVWRRGVFSAFNQCATLNLNRFQHNWKAWTRVKFFAGWPWVFPRRRRYEREARIYENYRVRRFHEETWMGRILRMRFFHWGLKAQKIGKMVLTVEELATIFHPPTQVVLTGPMIKRVEARKMGPPAGLPIYGEGEEELPGAEGSRTSPPAPLIDIDDEEE